MKACFILGAVGLSVLMMAGCSADTESEESLSFAHEELYGGGTTSTFWNGLASVPVCFAADGNDARKTEMREILLDTWGRVGKVPFTGFGKCTTANPANTIRVSFVADTRGRSLIFGPSSSGATNVEVTSNDTAQRYRYQVIHEFGHAIGFVHDQNQPANFDSSGNRIFCKETSGGGLQAGGIQYSPVDNASIMSYCATGPSGSGFPTELSPGDVVGLRATPYGSNKTWTCANLSDTYGIVANSTFGFAPTTVQQKWTSMACNTTPSSSDACQKASDLYGIDGGVTFGFAPQSVRTWWTSNNCNTKPRNNTSLCQRASETYGISANQSFGTAPSEVQTWWTSNNCSTQPRYQDTCQHLSDLYGITAGVTFGWAPSEAQTYWTANACETKPLTSNLCQLLSDNFGLSPSETKGAAPTAARTYWTTNSCNTSPKSANTCQRASDLYGINAGVTFGSAPSEVQTWWTSKGCNTKPANRDVCQVASDQFGITANVTFGAAPSNVKTWWTSAGCTTQPRDAAPIPG